LGSPKFQIDFDSGSKGDVKKEPLDKPITPYEVTKKKRQKINVLEHP
jgi:hypothetical protein